MSAITFKKPRVTSTKGQVRLRLKFTKRHAIGDHYTLQAGPPPPSRTWLNEWELWEDRSGDWTLGQRTKGKLPPPAVRAAVARYVNELNAQARSKRAKGRAPMRKKKKRKAEAGQKTVVIRYRAVKNKREGYGWLPIINVRGKDRGDTWAANGYDKETALAMAQMHAKAEAERYIGDWHVVVEKG